MTTPHRVILTWVCVVTLTYAAGPPGHWRALTKDERIYVQSLNEKQNRHINKAEFEETAKIAKEIADFRTERQGRSHYQAIDALHEVEIWQGFTRVAEKDRHDLLQAMAHNQTGMRLQFNGQPLDGEKRFRQALEITKRILGEFHSITATGYNNLAYCLEDLDKNEDALLLHRKALIIRRKVHGESHPNTAASYNGVASCLKTAGKVDEALPLCRKALTIRRKILGELHPHTATSYNNVASCLKAQGKAWEALPLYQESLRIHQQVFGENHPETASGYNNVGLCMMMLGKVTDALPLFQNAVQIREAILGDTHPGTAESYTGLALCLQELGRSAEALPLYESALRIRRKVYGDNHQSTAESYNNVGYCFQGQGKSAQALPLFQNALQIDLQLQGENHANTATSYNNIASCLMEQEKLAEALPLYQRALRICQKVCGENHPLTAGTYNNLAGCLKLQRKLTESLPLYQNALRIRLKVFGEKHPGSATSYNNLAQCLEAQGKADEALPLFRRSLRIYQQVFGEIHPTTAMSHCTLARCLLHLGRHAEADRSWQNAILGYEYGRLSASDSGFERAEFQDDHLPPAAALAISYIRRGNPRAAWEMAERKMGRGLLDDLAGPDAVSVEDQKKIGELKILHRQLLPLITLQTPDDSQKTLINSLVEKRDKLQREIAGNAVRRAQMRVLSLAEVQKSISADTAIIFWLDIGWQQQHLGCIVRHHGDPKWIFLPGTGKNQTWRREDATVLSRALTTLQNPIGQERELSVLLDLVRRQRMTPLEPHLKSVRNLIVLPTGEMSAFPVEVLTDRYTISYAPSASIYAKQRQNHRSLEAKSALVLADPTFERSQEKDPTPPTYGLLVTSVLPKSLGARVGLQAGDVLLEYADKKLKSQDDLQYPNNDMRVIIALWRDGRIARGRISGGNLGLTFDKRPIAKAFANWRQRQEKIVAMVRGKGWTPLPGTFVEAQTLKALIPDATLLLGSDANETKLAELAMTGKLKTYRILHLATHGEANDQLPLKTSLILAQNKLPSWKEQEERIRTGKNPVEGRLTVETVLKEWHLDADLVVLSACQTGLGKKTESDGMLGFTQALLHKGARSVLLTRWEVDDAATSLLMRRFYQNLMGKRDGVKTPLSRAEALKEAKMWLRRLRSKDAQTELAVMLDSVPRGERGKIDKALKTSRLAPVTKEKKDRPFDHPYYWAAFILVGDPE